MNILQVILPTVKSIASAPLFVAHELWLFQGAGFSTKLHVCETGADVFIFLQKEWGIVGFSGMIPYERLGMSHYYRSFYSVCSSNDNCIISRYASFHDHMVFGYVPDTISEIWLEKFLNYHALEKSDRKSCLAEELPIQLLEGSIDAYSLWEPFIFYGQRLLEEKAYVFDTTEEVSRRYLTMFVNKKIIEQQETLNKIVSGITIAQELLASKPEVYYNIVASYLNMPVSMLQTLRHKYDFAAWKNSILS